MPKERLHLLLADESLHWLEQSRLVRGLDKEAYLLGAILPDIFFYDVPRFKLDALGNGLHRFQGEATVDFFKDWLQDEREKFDREMESWMLGFCSHMLADGLLHPSINDFCRRFSAELHLTPISCHHWLESELESQWLSAIGPRDGYLPLLERFGKGSVAIARCLGYYQKLLLRAKLVNVPMDAEIDRCLVWQTRALRLFSSRKWSAVRPWLLRSKWGTSFGVLLVPRRSVLRHGSDRQKAPHGDRPDGTGELWPASIESLCTPRFMAQAIGYLASRLSGLAERF